MSCAPVGPPPVRHTAPYARVLRRMFVARRMVCRTVACNGMFAGCGTCSTCGQVHALPPLRRSSKHRALARIFRAALYAVRVRIVAREVSTVRRSRRAAAVRALAPHLPGELCRSVLSLL